MAQCAIVCAMRQFRFNFLPDWIHPRFPLVAKEIRHFHDIDFRITQFGDALRPLLRTSFLFSLFGFSAIFVVSGPTLFGFILFPLTVIIGVIAVIGGSFLYWRVLLSVPPQISQMIIGEWEHGTWETLLSTPILRHQIILSKFSAIFWNNVHALWPLLLLRLIFAVLLLIEHLLLTNANRVISAEQFGTMLLIGTTFWLTPLIEIAGMAGVGLLLSVVISNRVQITLVIWLYWLMYRLVALVILLPHVQPQTDVASIVVGLFAIPHWTLLQLWISVPIPERGDLLIYGSSLYVGCPLLLCIISLALTIRFVQYRGILRPM